MDKSGHKLRVLSDASDEEIVQGAVCGMTCVNRFHFFARLAWFVDTGSSLNVNMLRMHMDPYFKDECHKPLNRKQ